MSRAYESLQKSLKEAIEIEKGEHELKSIPALTFSPPQPMFLSKIKIKRKGSITTM